MVNRWRWKFRRGKCRRRGSNSQRKLRNWRSIMKIAWWKSSNAGRCFLITRARGRLPSYTLPSRTTHCKSLARSQLRTNICLGLWRRSAHPRRFILPYPTFLSSKILSPGMLWLILAIINLLLRGPGSKLQEARLTANTKPKVTGKKVNELIPEKLSII